MKNKQGARLMDIAYVTGEQCIKTADSESSHELPRTRTFALKDQLPRDLALAASKKLVAQANFDKSQIDLILYSSSFADTVNIGFGPFVQKELGAINASVLQVDCACASFLAQVEVAEALLAHGKHKNILLITVSSMISRLPEAQKQPQGQLMGEGAAALLLSAGDSMFHIESLPSVSNRRPINPYPQRAEDHDWYADATPFRFLPAEKTDTAITAEHISAMTTGFKEMLKKNNLTTEDLSHVVCNYPNRKIVAAILDRLMVPENKLLTTFDETGDLAQASLPVNIARVFDKSERKNKIIGLLNFSLDGEHIASGLLRY